MSISALPKTNKKPKRAMFAVMITSDELDLIRFDAESLAASETADISAIGRKLKKAVDRTALRLGFKYEKF